MAIAIDPVCGMEVDTITSQYSLAHGGATYWFCGKGCLLDFRDDPAAYLEPIPTPPEAGSRSGPDSSSGMDPG
jgi:Cu+-exporting ATPase